MSDRQECIDNGMSVAAADAVAIILTTCGSHMTDDLDTVRTMETACLDLTTEQLHEVMAVVTGVLGGMLDTIGLMGGDPMAPARRWIDG